MNTKATIPASYIQDKRNEIGDKIREIRERQGYSQEQLAELMEINRATLSKIENGKFAITIDYLYKIAWYLDFDVCINDNNPIVDV